MLAANTFKQTYNMKEIVKEKDFEDDVDVVVIGHPCNNKKMEEFISCLTWPYDKEVVVKVEDNNLLIAGTNASLLTAVRLMKDNPEMFNETEVVLKQGVKVEPKPELKVRCGDKICTPREIVNCPGDCVEKMSCEQYCEFFGYLDYSCSTECKPNEKDVGKLNCENVCCCKVREPVVPDIALPSLLSEGVGVEIGSPPVVIKDGKKVVDIVPQKPNLFALFFKAVWQWLKTIL
ncbi:hypothetical protein D6777_04220 [Candidatus Woesearchaeota archaeon]|nr:MAG: hypothetical protein D6777_04220 [Candidatus Woesearchaeota archaeon]